MQVLQSCFEGVTIIGEDKVFSIIDQAELLIRAIFLYKIVVIKEWLELNRHTGTEVDRDDHEGIWSDYNREDGSINSEPNPWTSQQEGQ